MLSYCCAALIKECRNGILCTPNRFFSIHYLYSICLILRLENQELRCTISYFSTLCHIINFVDYLQKIYVVFCIITANIHLFR